MTVQEWVDAYRRAWESRDPEAAAALFTEDASYRSQIFEEPHVGTSGVTEYWTSVTEAQRDVSVRMGRPFLDDDRVAVEFWTTMQASGSPLTLAGCLLVDFAADGRCRHLREYWNLHDQIVEPPTDWGS